MANENKPVDDRKLAGNFIKNLINEVMNSQMYDNSTSNNNNNDDDNNDDDDDDDVNVILLLVG